MHVKVYIYIYKAADDSSTTDYGLKMTKMKLSWIFAHHEKQIQH